MGSEKKAVSTKKMAAAGDKGEPKPELSRREREAMEAQRKAEAYRKKHEAGETDEAKADLARLQEGRKRREEAKKKKEAEAAAAASAEAEKAEKEKAKSAKQEKVVLPTPTQKEMKSALIQLQDCANEDFQKKWKLDSMSGNKLAKMKYSDFKKLWEDFVENCSDKEHRQ